MAKLSSPPDWSIIGRLKKPLDFYVWKGIWCARYYPLHINQPGTPEQQETWNAMLAAVDGYNELARVDREAWHRFVRDSHRTGKDLYYRLHLKGQTDPAQPWVQLFLYSVTYKGVEIRIWVKSNHACLLTLSYAWNKQQSSAYWWRKEGYCIRGRKWVRKRRLIENWPYARAEDSGVPSLDHKFTWAPGSGWRYIQFTVRECEHPTNNYRGRMGAYRFDEGEVYP